MRHRHHPISRETPTLCTTQSRGFVFILRSFAPSALDVVAEVEHHRKATAALLLPSAALEPNVERMWSVQAAVQIAQRREVGQIESVELVVCAIQFVQFVIGSDVEGVSRFCEPLSSFARRGAFFEELAVPSQKLRGSGRNLPVFLPKVRRCFPPPRPFSAQCVAVCKKIPRCLPDSGGMCCGRAPWGNEGRGAGLALGAGAQCPVRNAIYLFSLGRIEWCRADPDLACFYCEGRNPRSNYLRLRS